MDTLPQELLVMITANVSDFNDLKRCALVCRDLYSASRIHFFHMVRLEIGQSHSRSLHRVLTASPHHAPLIRVLEIYDNRYSLKDSDLVDSFAEFAAVLLLLTHLENIQLLLISKIHHPPRFFTALSDAIIPSLKLPSLITWRIITAHPTLYELDHADLLIHATSLKNLSISKLYTTESRAATKALPAKAGPRARLEVLHCRFEYTHYGAEQRWLLPELRNVDLTGLHALRMFQLSPAAVSLALDLLRIFQSRASLWYSRSISRIRRKAVHGIASVVHLAGLRRP
ncbi:hypothetical protein FPV67DRAFT_1485409 [Lyophyllum atratum]|nr:hypothetical protein FPV67DRAFT_1485409 [Lyophyllum atratum]